MLAGKILKFAQYTFSVLPCSLEASGSLTLFARPVVPWSVLIALISARVWDFMNEVRSRKISYVTDPVHRRSHTA